VQEGGCEKREDSGNVATALRTGCFCLWCT
jgi:hypothetical protein